jgi:exodeoxyribonuclease VII small subunit
MSQSSNLEPGPPRPDPASLSFEQARDALATVVARLQQGTDSLQESLDLWEWGEQLAQRCEEFLSAAAARVERVVGMDPDDGALATGPTRG